jgi:hypothetical protein
MRIIIIIILNIFASLNILFTFNLNNLNMYLTLQSSDCRRRDKNRSQRVIRVY